MKYFRNKNKLFFLIIFSFIFLNCKNECCCYKEVETYNETDAPKEIAERAYNFAKLYEESETVYEYGGQDPARKRLNLFY